MRERLRAGHWLLIGIVAALLAVVVIVVARQDGNHPQPSAAPSASAATSPAAGPVCAPVVEQSGFTAVRAIVQFGLVVTNSCAQAAVNTQIKVDALNAGGLKLPVADGPDPSIVLPVLLPGQRAAVGGEIALSGSSSRTRKLVFSLSGTQNLPATEFSSWPHTVTAAVVNHTGPDDRGITDVSGTVTTDPPGITLCNPAFYLVLRNAKNTIVYGGRATQAQPIFSDQLPAGVDWSTAEISVIQGVPTLGSPSGARLSCRSQ